MTQFNSIMMFILFIVFLTNGIAQDGTASDYIIQKENGRIILAYKSFEDFLESDRSWENYQKMVLNSYPEMLYVHNRQISWGVIDSLTFPENIRNYDKEKSNHYFTQYDRESLNDIYDSVFDNAHKVLAPINDNPVDLCFFFPYGGCFVNPEDNKSTIYISLYINPDDVRKIMMHEYAHHLHFQRCPEEPLTLRREVVSEGMAVYLTTLIDENLELRNAIPFMPTTSVDWCMKHEEMIKDSIQVEMDDSGQQIFYRYISDGSIANPPQGFVQKTAYYIGYRIVEACINKGMKLEEICSLDSRKVIEKSGYFGI